MSRYIDADVISSFGGVIAKEYDKESFIAGMEEVLKRARNASSIDIVICKECEHWSRTFSICCIDEAYPIIRNENDFCSHGERREQC